MPQENSHVDVHPRVHQKLNLILLLVGGLFLLAVVVLGSMALTQPKTTASKAFEKGTSEYAVLTDGTPSSETIKPGSPTEIRPIVCTPGAGFQDVNRATNPYPGILQSNNVATGFTCGGVGEQCYPPANLNYYRPNSTMIRGEAALMVSRIMDILEPPSDQIFEDVPPSSIYYTAVQAMHNQGLINGYECRTEGSEDPCIGPLNRPYFHPMVETTRGQFAKMLVLAERWNHAYRDPFGRNAENWGRWPSGNTLYFRDVPSTHFAYGWSWQLVINHPTIFNTYSNGTNTPDFRPMAGMNRNDAALVITRLRYGECLTPQLTPTPVLTVAPMPTSGPTNRLGGYFYKTDPKSDKPFVCSLENNLMISAVPDTTNVVVYAYPVGTTPAPTPNRKADNAWYANVTDAQNGFSSRWLANARSYGGQYHKICVRNLPTNWTQACNIGGFFSPNGGCIDVVANRDLPNALHYIYNIATGGTGDRMSK